MARLARVQRDAELERFRLESELAAMRTMYSQAKRELEAEKLRGPAATAFDLSYSYDRHRIVELSTLLVAHLEAKPATVDAGLVFEAMRGMQSDWAGGWSDNPAGIGNDLSMLLAICRATQGWFSLDQLNQITRWSSLLT